MNMEDVWRASRKRVRRSFIFVRSTVARVQLKMEANLGGRA